MNYSPLRYPGGKSKLAPLIEEIIKNISDSHITYIEPFAGGAGIALYLLIKGKVDRIIINDYDKAIYSFWRAVKESPKEFIMMIKQTPITIEEWHRQKWIYNSLNHKYSIELGFSAFYLNRTNRSGILNAGPIGGYNQAGKYLLSARFNKNELINKIQNIAKFKDKILVYNKEVRKFIRMLSKDELSNSFIYFDPPYYVNGQRLYKNALAHQDHRDIAQQIIEYVDSPWVITYDNVDELRQIYAKYPQGSYYLNYSAANKGKGKELIFFSSSKIIPGDVENYITMYKFK